MKPRKDKTMDTALTEKATPAEAAELQYLLVCGSQRAYEAAHEPEPWGDESLFQTAAECNQAAIDVMRETLYSGMRHPGEPAEDFRYRTRAEAQAAAAKHAGFQAEPEAEAGG
jgi:hypothetical protein